jgi:diguanylate cyclase (GGDEF)-like protein
LRRATAGFMLLAWWLGGLPPGTGDHGGPAGLTNLFGYVAARRYQILWREEYSAQMVLKNLSVRDPLTGCYNRRHLHDRLLETEISRAQRYRLSLTVIMCDLDHFKAVNDTYGHYGGDAVLQRFAALLQSMTRDSIDSVVRYGGEEFLLILPETDLAGGELLAERLRQTLADTDGRTRRPADPHHRQFRRRQRRLCHLHACGAHQHDRRRRRIAVRCEEQRPQPRLRKTTGVNMNNANWPACCCWPCAAAH